MKTLRHYRLDRESHPISIFYLPSDRIVFLFLVVVHLCASTPFVAVRVLCSLIVSLLMGRRRSNKNRPRWSQGWKNQNFHRHNNNNHHRNTPNGHRWNQQTERHSDTKPKNTNHVNRSDRRDSVVAGRLFGGQMAKAPYHQPLQTNGTDSPFFGSRKRTLEQINFVYPRQETEKDEIRPYTFGKDRQRREAASSKRPNQQELDDQPALEIDQNDNNKKRSEETLDDILDPRKSRKRPRSSSSHSINSNGGDSLRELHESEKETREDRRTDSETENSSSREGQLTGRSVAEAVKDTVGCRPRSNSTDGELKLPQRGLCDERTVLRNHLWSCNRIEQSIRPRGFYNLGNTCFLNSTLQCLAYLPPFAQSLIDLSKHDTPGQKLSPGKRITLLMHDLFRRVHHNESYHNNGNNTNVISPASLVKAVPTLSSVGGSRGYKFRPGRQEDAHEFLVHLLDAMKDGELREAGINQNVSGWRDRLPIPRLDETTFVHRVFGGYLRSQVKCTDCGYCSNTYDPFMDLALEVSRNGCSSVASAFQEYTRVETLDARNKWECSGCKKRVCAQKQLTVFRPPLALCIQLKRFSFSGFGGFGFGGGGKKISKSIQFPSQKRLPLSDGRSCAYTLTGIVVHVGSSASSGHYTAFVKKPGSEKWYYMDDSHVEQVTERTVLQQRDAYLLFYSRKEVRLEFPTPPMKKASMTAKQALEMRRMMNLTKQENGPLKPIVSTKTASPSAMSSNLKSLAEARAEELPPNSDSSSSSSSGSSSSSDEEADTTMALLTPDVRETTCEAPLRAKGITSSDTTEATRAEERVCKMEEEGKLVQNASDSSTDKVGPRQTIVVDRGAGHGKVEVMLGPRREKKPWQQTNGVSKRQDEMYGLLGNTAVDRWSDDESDDKIQGKDDDRSILVRQMEREDSARKRKMHLGRWDRVLDQGKRKKTKATTKPGSSHDPVGRQGENRFQRIQSSVRQMNRGRFGRLQNSKSNVLIGRGRRHR